MCVEDIAGEIIRCQADCLVPYFVQEQRTDLKIQGEELLAEEKRKMWNFALEW